MRLPIDTQHLSFIVASAPEPVLDFESKAPRTDTDGRPLFAVSVVALGSEGADILTVKVAGEPRGITQGLPVRVAGLLGTTWQMGDRHGVSFRAEVIEPLGGATTTKASATS
ncbi:MAG: hypothetical protein M0Z82_06165 [Actinomycetota bacterium]|nr:hypothetical protein [Actinomycetota bacterium]